MNTPSRPSPPTPPSDHSATRQPRRPMRTPFLVLWGLLALVALAGFLSLGQWQLERRAWKHDLMARVEARLSAAPVAAPARDGWAAVSSDPVDHEYRRVSASGSLQHAQTALVQASTVLGPGYWVITPLLRDDGTTVMVNRGFVPTRQPEGPWRDALPAQEPATVTGLLRLSEPVGGFLRENDPAADRWFSRDVAQIAESRGLELAEVAPYFIDADGRQPLPVEWTLEPPVTLPDASLPVGGLTVVSFHDKHLIYALTWYGLALMVALAAAYVLRDEYRLRRRRR